jgi:hypothetical protein
MATVTAHILAGSSHPYDLGVIPTHLLMLWEGDSAALSIVNLVSGRERKIYPKVPADIRRSVAMAIRSTRASAISVTVMRGSSLGDAADWFLARPLDAVYFNETVRTRESAGWMPVFDERNS